jgi:AcrR family transcriptional regulator
MSVTEPLDRRQRILDTARHLMAEHGVHAMSMRTLASACGLNVATLYHYFPSKSELLAEVVREQDYAALLAPPPPIDADRPPRERLAALLRWIWAQMAGQDDMWRLLLGESLRGDASVMGSAAELSALFEAALDQWIQVLFPELEGRARVARVLRGVVYGFFIEYLPLPYDDRMRYLAQRADEIAAVVFSD